MTKQDRIIPDGARHSGLSKDYGGQSNPDHHCPSPTLEIARLRKALDFYARREHWMARTENLACSRKLLVANGDTSGTNGWAVAEEALARKHYDTT